MATYDVGDYVKVAFRNEFAGMGEWMWLRVSRCDEQKQLVCSARPTVCRSSQISWIREHRRRTEFTKQ